MKTEVIAIVTRHLHLRNLGRRAGSGHFKAVDVHVLIMRLRSVCSWVLLRNLWRSFTTLKIGHLCKMAGHTRTHEDTITRKFDLNFLNCMTTSVFELEATSVIG